MKGWFIFNRVCANIVTRSSLRGAGGSGSLVSKAMKTHPVKSHRISGFSLIELLAVMAVVALMTSLLLPSISGLSGTAGRRGAVNTLMNTFEQARVAALESGQKVYVGFADANFPIEDMRYNAFLVFREATEEEKAQKPGENYVVLKKWTRLPKNVSIKRINSSLVPENGAGQQFSGLNTVLPTTMQDDTFPAITFNETGAIEGGSNPLQLFLYDGYYLGGQDNFTRSVNGGLFEKISFSRYTGRAQLDITATSGP